ncbi:hypothetical protein [Vibrio parahaemolyticus]|uniref:hypothetical protein n=1 Tax=Vibrio parahaemolyticus TaxID=670 RepID=UPI00111ECF9B|nr:hypothetical protein [Vibrio parahaemolyticus]TNY68239.1 hypothetical protein CGK63_21915 [Vibrio parahaemolyticus]
MIKNWTVITKAVKDQSSGVMRRERYLLSTKVASHKETKIIELIGTPKTSRRIAMLGEQYRLYQAAKQTRGGRPLASFAIEYCITLPKGISPTPEQWHTIITDCLNALAQVCTLSSEEYEQFKKGIRAVLHQQNQTSSKGTGDHVHFIVSKVLPKKGVLTALQKKAATRALKSAFTLSVFKHTNISVNNYTPSEINRSKRVEGWKIHYQRMCQSKEELKLIRQLQQQVDKWYIAKDSGDYKQFNRQMNRINKSINLLSNKELSEQSRLYLEQIKSSVKP